MEGLIKFITGTVLTTLTWLLGGWDIALQTLLVFLILDYITGVLKAIHDKKLSSEAGMRGIIKKVGYLIIVIVANFLDIAIGNTGAIHVVVIYFFVANEGISIMENWIGMGLPMPKIIGDSLEKIKEKGGKKKMEEETVVVPEEVGMVEEFTVIPGGEEAGMVEEMFEISETMIEQPADVIGE